ncbi:FAD-binding protein [Alphaproteobacteria bacterium LSUCC0684]
MRETETHTAPALAVTDREELKDALAAAVTDRTRLELRGQGSRTGLGRPVEAESVLDISALSGITAYEPDELVLMAKAATPLAEILKTLDDAGQMLAFDPPLGAETIDQAKGTIGGILATNLSGPRRLVAGAARDYLLGFQAVSGRGESFQSGSRVMKNVTGYDLSKLMAGSFGTLAVMHDVTIKTMPKPEDAASLIYFTDTAAMAQELIRDVFASPYEPSSAAIIPADLLVHSRVGNLRDASDQRVAAVIRIEGFEISIRDRADGIIGISRRVKPSLRLASKESDLLQMELRETLLLPRQSNRVIWKISCPTAAGGVLLDQYMARPNCSGYADWGGGLIWLNHPEGRDASAEIIRGMLKQYGGHATLYEAPENVRREVPVFHPQPAALHNLSRRVKAGFDPLGLLNPGRMYKGV